MASEGFTEQAAQTFQEIKAIIDEVATSFSLDEVTRKIASVSDSAFRNYIKKDGPQRGRISVFTCLNLAKYSGVPFEVFCGRQPFTEDLKNKFRDSLMKDFSPKDITVEQKSDSLKPKPKNLCKYLSDKNIKELMDYFAELVASKIYEKTQNNKNQSGI